MHAYTPTAHAAAAAGGPSAGGGPRFTRADIARLAAQDAEFGLRYVPPQPFLQMPLLPHFMPRLYQTAEEKADLVPTNQPPPATAAAAGGKKVGGGGGTAPSRSRSGSISSATRPPTDVSQSQPRASVRAAAARKAAALDEINAGKAKLSASARPSRSVSKQTTPLLEPQPAPTHAAAPAQSTPFDNTPAPALPPPVSARSHAQTPRGSQANSRAGLRIGSPRGGNTPRSRSRSLMRQASGSGSGGSALTEHDVKALVQTLLQEELSRVASVDARLRADEDDLSATRALRHDLLLREDEERRRRLEEETKRPNYYIHQAKAEVRELGQQILPLLEQADAALKRLYTRTGVTERMSSNLLTQLSAASAQAVANHADQLGDLLLDSILTDTVRTLDTIERQKQSDHAARATATHLGNAWEMVERVEAEVQEIENRWRKGPEAGPHPSTAFGVEEAKGERRLALPNVPLPSPSYPPPQPQQQQQQQQRGFPPSVAPASSSDSFVPPSSHLAARPSRLDEYVAPQRSYSSHATHSTFPVAAAAGASSTTVPASAAAASSWHPSSSSTAATPSSSSLAALPLLPDLVASVQSHQREYAAWRVARTKEQFLMPTSAAGSEPLALHTIVAAAGDDVFDDLLTQACDEVGSICDGYVERVFEAEFAIDLEQMADQDVEEQMSHQRQQQPPHHTQQEPKEDEEHDQSREEQYGYEDREQQHAYDEQSDRE